MYVLLTSSCWLIGYSQIWGWLSGSRIKWAMSNFFFNSYNSSRKLLNNQYIINTGSSQTEVGWGCSITNSTLHIGELVY